VTGFSPASRITLTLCFMALLALVSLIPGDTRQGNPALIRLLAQTPTLLQKVLHVLLYGILALLLAWTLDGIQSGTYQLLIALLIAVTFGAVMEWGQTRVPGRFGTVQDIALNATGAALGLLAAAFIL
jgi:VanZ family protein